MPPLLPHPELHCQNPSYGKTYMLFNKLHTSYATLSSGITWNVPRVTCIFQYIKCDIEEYFL